MLRIVIDTNGWIRILLRGPQSLPILIAWQVDKFQLVTSQPLLDEFNTVWRRPDCSGPFRVTRRSTYIDRCAIVGNWSSW